MSILRGWCKPECCDIMRSGEASWGIIYHTFYDAKFCIASFSSDRDDSWTTKISQDTINKAPGPLVIRSVAPSVLIPIKTFILTMLFLKYISGCPAGPLWRLQKQYGDAPELIEAMMANERFALPKSASFTRTLWAPSASRVTVSVSIRHCMPSKKPTAPNWKDAGKACSSDIFNTDRPGEENRRTPILRQLLEDFAGEDLNLKLSRVGTAGRYR